MIVGFRSVRLSISSVCARVTREISLVLASMRASVLYSFSFMKIAIADMYIDSILVCLSELPKMGQTQSFRGSLLSQYTETLHAP